MLQSNFIKRCISDLKLKRPIIITLKTRKSKKAEAIYWPTFSDKKGYLTHNITIYNLLENTRDIKALIVHELIHAWQQERNIDENHGKFFKKTAKILSESYKLADIYIKGTDKEK